MSTSTVQTLVDGQPVPIQGLYYDSLRDCWYTRPRRENGTRSRHTLSARTQGEAIKEFHRLDKAPVPITVKKLIEEYLKHVAAGSPGTRRRVKEKYATAEKLRCVSLSEFFGTMQACKAQLGHCMKYAEWRRKRIGRKGVSGGRTIDLDMVTLSKVFHHGAQQALVDRNPFMAGRPVFAQKALACRERCCRSGDELHRVAAALSGIVRWQFLFESCSGCRTGEALSLRRDAEEGMPGWIRTEGGERYLCIHRLKQGDENPYDYIHINPALALVLAELDAWHAKLKAPSNWFFPGRDKAADQPLYEGVLSRALKRKAVLKLLPKGRLSLSSHGCRAFYVTWRRTQGIALSQIAVEIGQRSGVKLVEETYGRNPPTWAPKNEFSPFPKTVPTCWNAAASVAHKNGSGTRFGTTSVSISGTRFDTLEHSVDFQTVAIAVNHNGFAHTTTR